MEVENGKIASMQKNIKSLEGKIIEQGTDIKDIHDALLGDDFNPGFKQRIEKIEIDTDENTSQINKVRNYIVAIVSAIGIIGGVLGILAKTGVI